MKQRERTRRRVETGLVRAAAALLAAACLAAAVEPNYVRTTLKNYGMKQTDQGEEPTDVVTTEWSDGLGRLVQTQTLLSDNTSLMAGIYYDEAGRPWKRVTPFLFDPARFTDCGDRYAHIGTAGHFVPLYHEDAYGDGDQALVDMACCYFDGQQGRPAAEGYPFAETRYYPDPLSRVKDAGAPGKAYSVNEGEGHPVRYWYFGVTGDNQGDLATHFDSHGFLRNNVDWTANNYEHLTTTITGVLAGVNAKYHLIVVQNEDGGFGQDLKDVFGRTVRTWADPDQATASTGDELVAAYRYDILGQVLEESPPNDLVESTTYRYSTLGQLLQKETPDAGMVKYRYDKAGRRKLVETAGMRARGEYLVRLYDKLGRETHVGVVDDAFAALDDYLDQVAQSEDPEVAQLEGKWEVKIARVYDGIPDDAGGREAALKTLGLWNDRGKPALNVILNEQSNGRGRLVAEAAWDEGGKNVLADFYAYDEEGRLRIKHKWLPGLPAQAVEYDYDHHGRITRKVYHNGGHAHSTYYDYGEQGALHRIRDDRSVDEPVVRYAYNDLQQLETRAFAGDEPGESVELVSYRYNMRGWMTRSSSGSFVQALYYDDPPSGEPQYGGNVAHSVYAYPGILQDPISQSYEYDDVSRLESVAANEPSYTGSYSYDAIGRFMTKDEGGTVQNLTYDYYDEEQGGKTSRLRKVGGGPARFVYDEDGNVIVDFDKRMTIFHDWRGLPVEFRFYGGDLPDLNAGIDDRGEYNGDARAVVHGDADTEVVATVNMFYDAAGNRVYKIEH